VLQGLRPVDQPVALLGRFVLEQPLPMQRQNGNGVFVGVGSARGNAGVAGRGERRAFRRARLVERLVQRVLVDVAVESVRADVR
jgi:hypothetical protein